MYDPSVGQFLSEDPIEFEGLDENLKRYVRNRTTDTTDPSGLSPLDDVVNGLLDVQSSDLLLPVPPSPDRPPGTRTYPIPPNQYPPLFVPVNYVDLTTLPNARNDANQAIDGANFILSQAGVVLQNNGFTSQYIDPALGPTTYNADTDLFSGGGLDGKPMSEVLAFSQATSGTMQAILVDRLIVRKKLSFGVAVHPGNRASVIAIALNYGYDKNADTPERTLAHECVNYFGLPDRDNSGNDPINLMSYGKVIGQRLVRGTDLDEAQISQLRSAIIDLSVPIYESPWTFDKF